MTGYNPALGTAPEARKMIEHAAGLLHDLLGTGAEVLDIACSFPTIATVTLPIVLKVKDVEPNADLPPTLFGLPIRVDDSIPFGVFEFESRQW